MTHSIRPRTTIAFVALALGTFFASTGIDAAKAARQRAATRPARAEAFAEAARRGLNYLPGEVIVKFKPGSSSPARARALTRLRSRLSDVNVRWIGNVAVLNDPSEPDSERLARLLAVDDSVEFAQPNYIRKIQGWTPGVWKPLALAPVDPTRQPADPDYKILQWNFGLINMPGAWSINPGGSANVIVGVIDTGLTGGTDSLTTPLWTGSAFETKTMTFARSPDFSASRIVTGRDFVFFDAGAPVLDFVGHGTHVASTIAEDANALSVLGIAYNTRLMPLKVCFGYWEIMIVRADLGITGFIPPDAGGCDDAAVAEALYYGTDHGVRVFNLSLSGPSPSPVTRDALVYAVSHGAFVSIAVGNEFEDGNPVEYPAAYGPELEGVMAVSAVGKSQARAYYSNTGKAEIAAPGGSNRDGANDDERYVWQVTIHPFDQDPGRVLVPRFDRYAEVGYIGTSMAAPHVAGVAALLMSQGDLKNPRAIEAFIKATARDIGKSGTDDEFGAGLVQAKGALFGTGIRK